MLALLTSTGFPHRMSDASPATVQAVASNGVLDPAVHVSLLRGQMVEIAFARDVDCRDEG